MTSEALVVLVGVDTLIVNARSPDQEVCYGGSENEGSRSSSEMLPDHLTEPLNLWLEMAKNAGEPLLTTWEHETRNLLLYPHGTPTHRYLLKNGFIDLMLGPLLNHGAPARVRFSSE